MAKRGSSVRRAKPEEVVVAIDDDNVLRDLADEVTGTTQRPVTLADEAGLDILRHTIAAQVLGRALTDVFSDAELAAGPTTDDGFFYDVRTSSPISEESLPLIESRMREILASGAAITKAVVEKGDVVSMFKERQQPFKIEIVEEDGADRFSIYSQEGSDFIDLCRGPHLTSLSLIDPDAFALLRVAGAYWRGDNTRPMLTRIYGTAWRSKAELDVHLAKLEEAKRRDHRQLAQRMDLFHLSPDSPGQVFWHRNGWLIYLELIKFIREMLANFDYEEINTPRIVAKSLYERSGHWDKFGTDNMFITEAYHNTFALKPMNCPSHVEVFNSAQRSYRSLPLRLAEFGTCYRRELSGAIHGLLRVTAITMDDAHIFCTMDQVQDEILALNTMIDQTYRTLGFTDYFVRFADRPAKRIGDDATWDRAEAALQAACEEAGIETVLNPGDGAFYGPKLEYVLRDAIGREWQCGTIQLDFNLPDRLDAMYTAASGAKERPVMIHRAVIGSLERFMGVLLEHFADVLPLWLAPVQVALVPVSDRHLDYCGEVAAMLRTEGVRVEFQASQDGTLNNRIREHANARTPIVLVIGDREVEERSATVRRLRVKQQASVSMAELVPSLAAEIRERSGPLDVAILAM